MRSKKPVLAGIVGALVVWQTLALNPFHVSAKNETGDHPASQILPGTITRQHGKGLYAIVFSVAAGAITVNVPDDIEAGDTVSINLKEQMAQGLAPAAQATVRKRLVYDSFRRPNYLGGQGLQQSHYTRSRTHRFPAANPQPQ